MSSITDAGSSTVLTAFFDSRTDAEEAVSRLRALGIAESSIRLVAGESDATVQPEERHKGFFEMLADFFMPDEDRYSYAEGLSRGGYLLTVSNIDSTLREEAIDILDDEGSVDFSSREDSWRSEGWAGYQAADDAALGTSSGYSATSGTPSGAYAGTERALDRDLTGEREITDRDETIPVVEEQLRVGKRDVNLGRVRVRSYVVEEPVNADVNLSSERVVVERRPVDRELSATDTAFTDRVLEADEHAEEAVVQKTARVTEEIGLRKEREEHTETVSDTVRHTEVEVEDDRAGLFDRDRDTGTSR